MAKARALDKRRKSIRNIRKITRTMELIATARFKKAMDRAAAASSYTRRITELVAELVKTGVPVKHPLLETPSETKSACLLVLTANRGLCGGYNGNVIRLALGRWEEWQRSVPSRRIEVSGKRGITTMRFRGVEADQAFTQFEDRPRFEEVEPIADRYLDWYISGKIQRLDVAYMQFQNVAKQTPVVQTLLPLGSLAEGTQQPSTSGSADKYEFLPSAASILHELVPTSFKVRLFKCFLDAAVSEQIARMVAMKSATENAGDLIRQLSLTYNRARQSQITSEIMEIIGGVEALNK